MERKEKFMPGPWRIYWSKTERLFLLGWQESSYRIAAADYRPNALLIAVAPDMYAANDITLKELDTIIATLLNPCHKCDKIFDGQRICAACAECDTRKALNAARSMRSRLEGLQKKARGEA